MYKFKLFSICLLSLLFVTYFHHKSENDNNIEHVHGAGYEAWINGPSSHPLSPSDALKAFQLQDNLSIENVAAEPFVRDPVLISFDANGRMWIAEMTNYMLDVAGTGETDPVGHIVILEDTDLDGKIDERIVFLSGIALPRAIAHVKGGILFADDNALHFASHTVINGKDVAGSPVVVDNDYASGVNVEHKENGLMYGLDNWLYNAKSNQKYRLYPLNASLPTDSKLIYKTKDWQLVKARTENRGQWGITKDDYGRLFYTNNSTLLIADSVPANSSSRNPKIKFTENTQKRLSDNNVYPNRPTLGINRAYDKSKLNEANKMIKATAVSGPVIYRGSNMPQFYGHAFSPEPAGNLISAINISEQNAVVIGKPFYHQQEFLTSTDERFRPVNTYTAPDGSMYFVDMYRGIIQDRFYLTQYLSEYILGNKLDKGVHFGRIYRVFDPNNSLESNFNLSQLSSSQLVDLLTHQNSWHRDTAKRLLIERQDLSVKEPLIQLALTALKDHQQISALWTLEGLNALSESLLSTLITNTASSNKLKAHVVTLSSQLSKQHKQTFLNTLIQQHAEETTSYDFAMALATTLGQYNLELSDKLLMSLVINWQQSSTISSLALSGLAGREAAFIALLTDNEIKAQLLSLITKPKMNNKPQANFNEQDQQVYLRGKHVFNATGCGGCHGTEGQGVDFAGPPLANSEWVTGDPDRLTALLLHGLTGPIHVDGILYNPGIDMPGLKGNNNVSLAEISALVGYLRNSWGNQGSFISIESVNKVLNDTTDRSLAYTEQELLEDFPSANDQ
ncbi:c-type cytochrome [Colwellia sp. 1_MG-2023]|uniref:PVC-type heme-binding CxxCH protein n=1 Tax=Colwellia sp. 1_MG-2023 TaxID=3062649 RepID=UPI0026E4911A|nr:PVC-type heme-binding CxxCH protein [Colwellia sp. 1_MG-2023]MDO6446957.1 c-type cytochrome [Colwellia sp. 1_MG-2023]